MSVYALWTSYRQGVLRTRCQENGKFPSLRSGFIFADNAGGSKRIFDYLLNTNAQVCADYFVSAESGRRIAMGPVAAAELFNAASLDEIAFGSSTTMNLENLARSLEKDILDKEEIIVTVNMKVSNVGPWKRLAARKGLILKHWRPRITDPSNPYSLALNVEDLLPLVSSKTRIVAFTACSNILGSIVPVKAVVAAARSRATELGVRKIEFCVDCVAYAPHRRMDVQHWDVFGPHISALYARTASLRSSLTALTHHFYRFDDVGSKLQPGGSGYELVYGAAGVPTYLRSLTPAGTLEATFEASAAHEYTLSERFLSFLRGYAPRVLVVGDAFVVKGIRNQDIIGIRYGHFYAYTLVNELDPKIDVDDGVARVSLVHYNTMEEVDRIIDALRVVLDDVKPPLSP
ncbi:pyridoxal phosphate-dependent transferase [Lactifluus subvellereus]|nr:pyridoxal phosphate-dependent transferase [Lactifluus subvellereus]